VPQITGPRDSLGMMFLLYNVTKAAVLHGTKLEAAEPHLTSRHITVAANCPGWCRVRALRSLSSRVSALRLP
jgi:NAD(P)-dependent dehydrogenase (short-subunit alcohol dehydrogenase family)